MSGFFQNLLKDAAGGFFGSEYLRDYTHASKSFRTNFYQNAPKFKFLFHCYFNINSDVYGAGIPPENFSILVRDVKLPSYTIQTAQMNQYNRKRIVQTKIKYDPVTFSFFDDNGNTIANLWKAYYNYYYNDGTIPTVAFTGARGGKGTDLGSANKGGAVKGLTDPNQGGAENGAKYFDRNLYQPSITGNTNWGYNSNPDKDAKAPFFKDITVFGLYQKSFIAYTLINPVITNFAHDTYNYDETSGFMKNNMTIDYETVVYNEGDYKGSDPSIVTGFGSETYYDKRLSPIAQPGSNNNILGQGGLKAAFNSLKNTDLTDPKSILGAIKTAGATYNTLKNGNLKQNLKQELATSFINVVRQEPNLTRNTLFSFLNPSAGPGASTGAGAPPPGQSGGTTNVQNTDKTLGTTYQQNPSGPNDFGPTALDYIGIPNVPPAGKQSNNGTGTNLPANGG